MSMQSSSPWSIDQFADHRPYYHTCCHVGGHLHLASHLLDFGDSRRGAASSHTPMSPTIWLGPGTAFAEVAGARSPGEVELLNGHGFRYTITLEYVCQIDRHTRDHLLTLQKSIPISSYPNIAHTHTVYSTTLECIHQPTTYHQPSTTATLSHFGHGSMVGGFFEGPRAQSHDCARETSCDAA